MIGPNDVKRAEFDFAKDKAHIVEALNDICKALDGIGVVGALHQHTGTCVETRDETYAVMEAVDTRVRQVRARRRPVAEGRSRIR